MSTSAPETNPPSLSEQQPKQAVEEISAYVVSWKWLLGGLACFLVVVGIAAGTYFVRTMSMSKNILTVVQQMIDESEQDKIKIEQASDFKVKGELMQHSLKLRSDAANLLNNYRQVNTETASVAVMEKLYDILEGLYHDSGEGLTPAGIERGKQLIDLAVILARTVPEVDSIKYRTRLLELEWARRNFIGILDRGKDLIKTYQATAGKENYDAVRYIALAMYDRLPITTYNPLDNTLPEKSFPQAMDELLKRLYTQKPEDIEIARRYAEFIADVMRPSFSSCASDQVRKMPAEERRTMAKTIIDDMVGRNKENPAAYLARYHFRERFLSNDLQDRADTDLETVLKLDPKNPEALILSSRDAFRQVSIAYRDKRADRAAEWKRKAEDFLRRTVRDNPYYPNGYQYLGDYLVGEGKPDEAVEVWNQGLQNSSRWADEELLGRLIVVLLDRKKIDEAREKLEALSRAITDMRITRPAAVMTAINMRTLLTARLYVEEASVAAAKIDATQRESRPEEVRRLFALIRQKRGEAIQLLDGLLRQFGKSLNDYVIERASIYARLLPQSLMLVGALKLEWGEWDRAAYYFHAAVPFDIVREQALLAESNAYQQGGQLEKATDSLKTAAERAPDNMMIRYAYVTSLFRSQLASNTANSTTIEAVQKELEFLDTHRKELNQPWVIDIRLIHLGLARANLSNIADQILEAQNEAIRKFRALEKGTFPPDIDGKTRNYIDDPAFVAELTGIYSGLAARSDFDRLLPKLREFPDGEYAYHMARVNDALRRDDKEGAIAVINEANGDDRLTATQKERFVTLLQNLKGENVDNTSALEKVYGQLKTTFDQNPESLKPQAFFLLANLSIDREDVGQAKLIQERLEKIEGPDGTMWRYVAIRLMLHEKDPDFEKMRQIQEDIVKFRPNWDMAYVLRAMVEERYFETNADDVNIRARLIESYQMATRNGNTQPAIWGRLASLFEAAGRPEDARQVIREAALRGVVLDAQTGQFPQPYARMYSQIQEAIANEDATTADHIARQCITLAEKRREKPELIFALNLSLGKAFFDASMYENAKRHLIVTARRGGAYVYPLSVCLAKSGDVDGGFAMLLDEIDAMPSATPVLLPSILVLLTQVKPSEAIYERIDRLMNRVEKGERLILKSALESSDENHVIPVGTKWVQSRKIQSLVIRFPENKEKLDPSDIQFITPDETLEEEQPEVPAQPAAPALPVVPQ